MKAFVAAAVLAALSVPAAASAAGFTNGRFEAGTFVGGSFGFPNAQLVNPGDTTTLPGWTTNSYEIAWFRTPQAGIDAQDGLLALDLTGFHDQGHAGVSQTFDTIAGATYHVGFWVGNYDQNKLDASILATAGNGGLTASVAAPSTGFVWRQFGFDFVALGSSTTLSFLGTGGEYDTGLDNVSVDFLRGPGNPGVPEPATWALMILGFGAVGVTARRRRALA